MRAMTFVLFLIFLFPTLAYTGQIFGSLSDGRKSVGQRVPVEVACGSSPYRAKTDRYGSYSIYSPKKGKCTLTVHYKGQSAEHTIYSYDDPVRYDFELIQSGEGYKLKRR